MLDDDNSVDTQPDQSASSDSVVGPIAVTVVVPTNNSALLGQLLTSFVLTHDCPSPYRFVIIDDGLIAKPRLSGIDITYVRGIRPFCFARNVNIGLREADARSDVFLMNDDTAFYSADLIPRLATMSHLRDVGVTTPVFNRLEKNLAQRVGPPASEVDVVLQPTHNVTFAAVYLQRRVLDAIGGFDENLVGYGFDDDDYCMRTREAGFTIGVTPSLMMVHGDVNGWASTTFRNTRSDIAEAFLFNRRYFLEKWARRAFAYADVNFPIS